MDVFEKPPLTIKNKSAGNDGQIFQGRAVLDLVDDIPDDVFREGCHDTVEPCQILAMC